MPTTKNDKEKMSTQKKERGQKELSHDDLQKELRTERLKELHLQIAQEMLRQSSEPLKAGLYLVATPIGNLGDITLRALSVLSRVDMIYCEDTRHSRTLLSHYKISQKLDTYHEHNAERQRPRILAQLRENKTIALISDAGTPLISDPGFKLVSETIREKYSVWVIPGPSAIMAGLSLGGLPVDRFLFGGFLPSRKSLRQKRILELSQVPSTLVFFETQSRLAEALQDLSEGLGSRDAAIGRELTKFHEEVCRGSLNHLADQFARLSQRGEFVIIIGPPPQKQASDMDIEKHLIAALKNMSLRDASKKVSDDLSISKTRIYKIGLKLVE